MIKITKTDKTVPEGRKQRLERHPAKLWQHGSNYGRFHMFDWKEHDGTADNLSETDQHYF